MAGRYRVTAPYVTVKQGDAVRGFYTDAVFEADEGAVEHLLRKGMVEEVEEPKPEPTKEPSVKDILAAVDGDLEAAKAALEAEQAKSKPRKSLIEGLEAVIAADDNGTGDDGSGSAGDNDGTGDNGDGGSAGDGK
jgi:hypothetical protein